MQMSSAQPGAFDRPRTRAWVKAQTSGAAAKPTHTQPEVGRVTRSATRERFNQPHSTAKQGPAQRDTQKQRGKARSTQKRGISSRFAQEDSHKKPVQRQKPLKSARSVPTWLRKVQPVSPERALQEKYLYTAPVPGINSEAGETMNSSSASRERQEDDSTVKITPGKTNKLTETKLRYRRVQRKRSDDERLPHLRSILNTALPARSMEDIPELGAVAQEFVDQIRVHGSESCYTFVDSFSLRFDEGKAMMRYPIVNNAYFDAQLKKCLSRNEAVLQRTIMMSMFHYYWLGDIFDWNAEASWSQPRDVRLPSREDDDITSPKPDLSISFTLRSFTGEEDDSDPIPQDLEKCITPDGGERCFPFIFTEVKKASADLQDAYLANLHTASQALHNIYLWMVRAGMDKAFFDQVRVFSLVFNAQDLSVRVHRASQLTDGNLAFCFDDFSPSTRYSRDQVCLLVNAIINDYGAKELHPILLGAFKEVIAQENERVLSKRKASATRRTNSTKRQGRSGDAAQHTGQSFDLSQLQT